MIVLLPEGRAVCNPDSIKLVKVLPNEIQGKKSFVVIVKLDDDTELMIKTLTTEKAAHKLADECADLINAAEGGDDSDDDLDSDDDDDSFISGLSGSEDQTVKGRPSTKESAETQVAPAKASAGSPSATNLESSSFAMSSEESSSFDLSSAEPAKGTTPKESSSFDLSSDEPAKEGTPEESSDWSFSDSSEEAPEE